MTKTDVPASVRAIVANYTRRAAWIEAMELQQEAALTMIEAARTWKPGGAPLSAYQGAAVAKRLSVVVAEMSSPVRPFAGKHHVRVQAASCPVDTIDDVEQSDAGSECRLDIRAAAHEVFRILGAQPPAARAVLLEERRAGAVASELGLPVAEVYRATLEARRALRSSERLRALMED
jgi:DNA-directed RNA polymerase specialized sigma24 family protein